MQRWFKRCWLRLRFLLLANYGNRQFSRHRPNRRLCEDLLNELRSEQFAQYRAVHGLGVQVVVPCATLDQWLKRLREAIRFIQQGAMIPPTWVDEEKHQLSLDRFLTSEDGYYLNIEQLIRKYKDTGLQLCHLMAAADTATVGLPEHNLRMLTKTFITMRELTSILIEVSLQT